MATRKRTKKRARPRKKSTRRSSVATKATTRIPMWLAVAIADRMGTREPWTNLRSSGLVLAHVTTKGKELIVLAPPSTLGHFMEDDDAEIKRIDPQEANALYKRGVAFESHGW